MGLEVGTIAIDVPGQYGRQRRAHGQQDGRMRRAHADDGRVGVGRVHLLHGPQHGLERMVGLDGHDGEGHVGRGDGLAVMEHGIPAQVQGQRLAVLGQLPGLGQVGLGLPLVIEAQRAGEQLGGRHGRGNARLHGAVQVPWHLGAAHDQGAAALRLLGLQRRGRQARQRAGQGQGRQGAASESDGVHGLSPSLDRQAARLAAFNPEYATRARAAGATAVQT